MKGCKEIWKEKSTNVKEREMYQTGGVHAKRGSFFRVDDREKGKRWPKGTNHTTKTIKKVNHLFQNLFKKKNLY